MSTESETAFIANLPDHLRRYWEALPPATKAYWRGSLSKFPHAFKVREVAGEMTVLSDCWERVADDMRKGRDWRRTATEYGELRHMDEGRKRVWLASLEHCRSVAEAESLAGQFMVMATLYNAWADQMPNDAAAPAGSA